MTYWANGLVNTFGPFLTQGQQVYTPDGEGRAGSAGVFTPSIAYNAASQPTVLQTSCANGTCYPITYTYDPNTLRMTQYSAALNGGTISGTLNWNPNGSLHTLAIANPFNAADNQTCTYAADDLSRLASVNCGSTWAQTFSYDAFGNLTKSGSISWMPGYDSSTNHYLLGGTSYDADGNVLNDTFAAYTWDADGKSLSTTYQGSGQVWSFTNDAFGHKVELSISGSYSTSYLTLGKFKLSATGQTPLYSEYPLPGGSILSQGGGATVVQLADWLGTIRAFYSYTGGSYSGGGAHAPFGETYANPGGYASGFAGEGMGDGDPNNTTYYFPERELRSSQGRWLSPDPAGLAAANPSNPQTWNRYAYVLNNPLSNIDPLGLDCVYLNDAGTGIDPNAIDHNSDQGECWDHGGYWANGYVDGNDPGSVQFDPNSDNVWIKSTEGGNSGWTFASQTTSIGGPFGGDSSAANNGLWGRLSDWLGGSAISVSGYVPLLRFYAPVGEAPFPVASLGGSGSVTWIPKTNTWCAGVSGGGAVPSGGKGLSLSVYPSSSAAHTQDVVSSWGWSLSGQPSPSWGYSVLTNSSGTLMGCSVATDSGLQATYGWTGCKSF